MQCQDNSKLRTPLNEVCVTPDIGCVPLVQGKPDCNPQPDQIPFAFDPWTTTLWIFNCRTREWVPFQKFRLCNDLVEVNLENLNHICEILRIPVFFNAGNGCQEGWITLQELVEQIKKCLHLKWQALCVDVDTLKINIKGLEDSLPPWYVRFENLWPVCGTGEEDDPIVIQTHDPLCKWPIKTVDDVVDAEVKHLGACLDDEMVRVPFPPRPCEFPQMTETAIASIPKERKNLIACVDGEEKKVPWIETPCEYPQYTQSQVENAADADVIFCVDGKNVKVPIPPNFFGPRPCEFPRTTQHLVESAHEKDIIICVDGVDHKVPVPSSFFTPDYLCVPEVVGMPTGPPAPGTGPLRADCDGTLWVWVCETGKWVPYNTGITDSVPHYKQDDVTGDICENVHFKAWYDSKSSTDPCLTESQMTLKQLVSSLKECDVCCPTMCVPQHTQAGGGWCIVTTTTETPAIWSSKTNRFIRGAGDTNLAPAAYQRWLSVKITNNFDKPSYLEAKLYAALVRRYSGAAIGPVVGVYYLGPDANYNYYGQTDAADPHIGTIKDENRYIWSMMNKKGKIVHYTGNKAHVCDHYQIMQPGETVTLYAYYWFLIYVVGVQFAHSNMTLTFRLFNNVVDCDYVDESAESEGEEPDDSGDDIPGGGIGD